MDYAKRLAQETGAEYFPPKAFYGKDKLVDRILRERPIAEGLICVLCCMECCPSFKLVYGKGRPSLVSTRRQQRVLYFYFLNPELGQIYIRLTTRFPFIVQVHVNSHSSLMLNRCSNDGWASSSRTTPSQHWTIPTPLRNCPICLSSRTGPKFSIV